VQHMPPCFLALRQLHENTFHDTPLLVIPHGRSARILPYQNDNS
jgi:hypothetical protein